MLSQVQHKPWAALKPLGSRCREQLLRMVEHALVNEQLPRVSVSFSPTQICVDHSQAGQLSARLIPLTSCDSRNDAKSRDCLKTKAKRTKGP